MPKHKHAELMLLYAQDAAKTDEPWELWEARPLGGKWDTIQNSPCWSLTREYRRIPEKTDLEKYGVEKGDVWVYGSSRTIVADANLGVDSFRDIFGYRYNKSRFSTLMFRRGVVDKL